MKKTMTIAYLVEHGAPLEFREVPIPEPGSGEALVKLGSGNNIGRIVMDMSRETDS